MNGAPQQVDGRTRVLVVDDHRTFSEALGIAIGLQEDLVCVGTPTRADEALALVAEAEPDVVLMDVRLPDMDGIDATQRAKSLRPEARVVILTAHTDLEVMARAVAAGASGFIPKESPIAEVLRSIRVVRDDGMLVEHATLIGILDRLQAARAPDADDHGVRLTRREREVLALMGQGLDARAIGKRLGISLNTCRGYQKSLMAKLNAHSQLEAVAVAARLGLMPPLAS